MYGALGWPAIMTSTLRGVKKDKTENQQGTGIFMMLRVALRGENLQRVADVI